MADWAIIAVRFFLYVSLGGLFGLSAFSLYGLRGSEREYALPLRPWLVAGAVLGLLLSAAGLVVLTAAMAGTAVWPVDAAAIGRMLDQPGFGTAWKARMVALAVALAAAIARAGRRLVFQTVALASGVALASLAWTGHGVMDEGATGWVHLVADILHLLAAGGWMGALLALLLLVSRPARAVDHGHLSLSHRALQSFGMVGTIVVGIIVTTGLVNAWLLVGPGNVQNLGKTLYGEMLIAKLLLFGGMLMLASLNRFRLTPFFNRSIDAGDHSAALRAVRLSLGTDTACAVTIMALVACLGTLEPPISAMQ